MTNKHTRWPKFQNLSRLLSLDEFDETVSVIALEKLDGSNLGIEIHPEKGIVALLGRNTVLWQQDKHEKSLQTIRYGSVNKTLAPIEAVIPKLMVVAQKLFTEETDHTSESIIFYGEWFQAKEQDSAPSWHPFGYSIQVTLLNGGQANKFRTMTLERHSMFLEHGLEPPALMFSGGTLCQAVDALLPTMIDPPRADFEGVFITSENGGTSNCAKWKTGAFEEQTSFQSPASCSEEMALTVSKLKLVFETKQSSRDVSSKKQNRSSKKNNVAIMTKEDQEMDRQIRLALRSVLSKSPKTIEEIRALDRASLNVEMKRLNAETLQDVCETYEASGMEPPPAKELRKLLGKLVAKAVFKQDR